MNLHAAKRSHTEAAVAARAHPARPELMRASPIWHKLATRIQTKLTVNQPGDEYEREADRVAEQVMRMPAGADSGSAVQRKCAGCEDELQRQPVEEEEEELQMMRSEGAPATAPNPSPSGVRAALSDARPLPDAVRSFFEPRFGAGLGGVRIATGPRAAEAAQSVHARAFTLGRSIAFNTGEYRPDTHEGRTLIAHELVHTLQQAGGGEKLQRYATCEAGEDCPDRAAGEVTRARTSPMILGDVSNDVSGVLVANFSVGSATVKSDLATNSVWTTFLREVEANPGIRWQVQGLTDCSGSESLNSTLRLQRAAGVFSMLPPGAIVQMDGFLGLPLSDCISDNATEEGRSLNRSVFFRQTSTTYDFEEGGTVTANPFVACYDGTNVYAGKGGATHSCGAVTGTVGDPTPDGTYCIRLQGAAQRTTWYRDRSSWYLLEPQFSTSRYRMHLHPGSVSAGCITVTDEDCFGSLAGVLNRPGTVTGTGYDGYPPGNAEGVVNPATPVTCVGWLKVNRTAGGCSFMPGAGSGT
jgi:outer membrane protein OmpA-like peptidoglycan-associated protein